MEMVLLQQMQSAAGGGAAACRPGPPTIMAAKQEVEADDGGDEKEELLRRGPWTVDEDLTLINYIADHGEGRWNALARAAGLKRTGKSCRLRWLNYLRPDVKRGDFTADEQLLILDLHSRWGNRWSKIAAHLPGRTDNEIKNYWRTRVQKHAKQLNCDVNSKRFKDAMRFLWMPRLAERATAAHHHHCTAAPAPAVTPLMMTTMDTTSNSYSNSSGCSPSSAVTTAAAPCRSSSSCSSLTSESAVHDDGAAAAAWHEQPPVLLTAAAAADEDYCWSAATTMQQQQQQQQNDEHYDFWSTACALQQQHLITAGDQDHLTGWVQGFSVDDGGMILSGCSPSSDNNLWSLEDIWRMQQ